MFDKIRTKYWKWYDQFLITFFMGWLFLKYPLRFGSGVIRRIVMPFITEANEPLMLMLIHYLGFLGVWLVVIAYFMLPRNRPLVKKLIGKTERHKPIRRFIRGSLFGFSAILALILIALLRYAIFIEKTGESILNIIILLLAMLVQASAEEALYRGLIYHRLNRAYSIRMLPLIGSSIVFGLIHSLNPGATVLSTCNLVLFGFLVGLLAENTNSIWAPIGFHWLWNFTQTIIFGLPNSGFAPGCSFFRVTNMHDDFAYNTVFGVEGTLCAFILLLLLIGAMFYVNEKRRRKLAERNEELTKSPE